MFSNPFRSFMSDFSATPPSAPSGLLATNKRFSAFQTGGANSNLPLLAVDSTLLRRRDTSWNPWSTLWLPSEITSIHLSSAQAGTNTNTLYSPAQIDPRFDPLFALMGGKLKLERGSVSALLPFARAAKEMVTAATRVPTRFPGDPA